MGTYNVNRGVTDAFYRYKMPRLMAKVEGKGNGIKTVIVNMVEVAKALGRPPTYPTKYFGCELGAQTQFDFKNERFIVNGSHDADRLQELLDGFIRKFVLCPECDNPETVLQVQAKRGQVTQICKACGHSCLLNHTHRLITFVLKNPPDQKPATSGSSLTEGKRGKRSKKHQNGNGSNGSPPPSKGEGTGSPPNPLSPVGGGGKRGGGGEEEDDGEDWSVDVSEEAVRERMEQLGAGVRGLQLADVMDSTEAERLDQFYGWVRAKLAGSDSASPPNPPQHLTLDARMVWSESERLGVSAKAPLLLATLLLGGGGGQAIIHEAREHAPLLGRFTRGSPRAQRYLLGGIEQVVAGNRDVLMPRITHILKVFYDLDILEEEVILDWGKKPSKKFVSREMSAEIRAKAAPFLKWLEEAEEEEDSDQ